MQQETILKFWFEKLKPEDWYAKNDALDQEIRSRFLDAHRMAANAELWQWRDTAQGALAEIIVLDQFSRNMFRESAQAFAYDGQALMLAQFAVQQKFHLQLEPQQRAFMLLPYMHSESLKIHQQALELFSAPGLAHNLEYEHKHLAILKRFGRYPHRNAVLGRESTAEELEFCSQTCWA